MDIPSITISVQQPWAWLIVNGFKDVENRSWALPLKHLGWVLIHAGLKPRFSFDGAREILDYMHAKHGLPGGLRYPEDGRGAGGIVGMARLVGCTRDQVSSWAAPGQWHWQIAEARPLPFMQCKGQLGFFRVDYRPGADARGSLVEVGG